jgi:hypothetical protein
MKYDTSKTAQENVDACLAAGPEKVTLEKRSIMIRAAVLLACVALSGCVNLYAGIAQYSVKPFTEPATGKVICCEAIVTSGKNAGSVVAHVTKSGDNFTFDLTEDAVNSSASITSANALGSSIAKAVSDTAISVAPLIKDLP